MVQEYDIFLPRLAATNFNFRQVLLMSSNLVFIEVTCIEQELTLSFTFGALLTNLQIHKCFDVLLCQLSKVPNYSSSI